MKIKRAIQFRLDRVLLLAATASILTFMSARPAACSSTCPSRALFATSPVRGLPEQPFTSKASKRESSANCKPTMRGDSVPCASRGAIQLDSR